MSKYCIIKRHGLPRVVTWPQEQRDTFKAMDKAGKLEGYTSREAAEKAIPECLREYCTTGEYVHL